jgi:hypothetical protein
MKLLSQLRNIGIDGHHETVQSTADGVRVKFEILFYRKKFSAVTRAEPGGVINWYSRNYDSEAEVRAAIEALAKTDWKNITVELSKY